MRRAPSAVVAFVLASCAITPEPANLPELESVPAAFEMSGRIAVRQGDRSDIAKLHWTHDRASDVWIISSPIGNEVARIESSEKGATLQRAGAEPESAADFGALTERLLGVPIAPRQLAGWLHGPAGSVTTGGWIVQVQETQKAGAVDIARLITARRDDTSVRLVVDQYRAGP